MRRIRRPLLALGVASSLAGLALIAAPALASAVELSGTLRAVPFALVGLAALVLAGAHAVGVFPSSAEREDSRPEDPSRYPRPETRPQYDRPGAAFARRLDGISWTDRRESDPEARLALRAELRELARDVLSRTEKWTESDVDARLNDGRWTDDPLAAAFFADDVVPSLSLRERLRSYRTPGTPFARRARHAVAELAGREAGIDVSADPVDSRSDERTPVTTREYWSPFEPETARETQSGRNRWVTAAALVAGGLGIVTLRPGLLLLASFGIVVAGYARVATPPAETVAVSRTVGNADGSGDGDRDLKPGDEIEVTVSVRNASDTTLADVRVVDGVPAGLAVTEGTARFTTALRPGKAATFTYTVRAVAGAHEFDPVLVVTRGFAGVSAREELVDAGSDVVDCDPPDSPAPALRIPSRTTVYPGRTQSPVEGPGVEFHSVREYRAGDPLSRIDWNRAAKTGELATVDFRERRLARAMVLLDARAEAYLAPPGDDRPVVRRGVDATRHVTAGLLSESVPVGVAALSPRPCWLRPDTGDAHRFRLRTLLAEHPAFSWEVPDGDVDPTAAVERFARRVGTDTNVVFVSPLADDEAARVARRLDASGYALRVVSPDPTVGSDGVTPDYALGYAALSRRARLAGLRSAGVPVLDWDPRTPFAEVAVRDP